MYLPDLARHSGHRVASWFVGEKVPWRGSVFMPPPPPLPCPFDLPMSRLCFLSVICNPVWPYFTTAWTFQVSWGRYKCQLEHYFTRETSLTFLPRNNLCSPQISLYTVVYLRVIDHLLKGVVFI